jgi:hypothetical protein
MSKKFRVAVSLSVMFALTICVGHLLLAQPSSDNYILKKWVISSGGGSMSSDNYQAVAVIGQSSPPGVSSSANYTLYSGFLQPIWGLPGEALVWIWTDTVNVYIDWDDVFNATSYNVYRASHPGVTATPGNLIGTSATSNYTDTNAVADSVKFFYLVTCSN